jgi:hypothetical protein
MGHICKKGTAPQIATRGEIKTLPCASACKQAAEVLDRPEQFDGFPGAALASRYLNSR